jgi:cbb3-type cytochrome oxidase subunit 1
MDQRGLRDLIFSISLTWSLMLLLVGIQCAFGLTFIATVSPADVSVIYLKAWFFELMLRFIAG